MAIQKQSKSWTSLLKKNWFLISRFKLSMESLAWLQRQVQQVSEIQTSVNFRHSITVWFFKQLGFQISGWFHRIFNFKIICSHFLTRNCKPLTSRVSWWPSRLGHYSTARKVCGSNLALSNHFFRTAGKERWPSELRRKTSLSSRIKRLYLTNSRQREDGSCGELQCQCS